MKIETAVTIEADLLEQVETAAKNFQNRSEVFEQALRDYLPKIKGKQKRKLTDEEEIEVLNRIADEEREEILETLSYQIDW